MKIQSVHFYDEAQEVTNFRDEVVRSLRARPKRIPPKYFYDGRGSKLFEAICLQPEYYLTRVETSILRSQLREIAAIANSDYVLIEFGSGASRKVRLLLEALRPEAYVAIDISREFLLQSTRRLARDYPWLEVHAVCADICQPLAPLSLPQGQRRIGFFPGSSIGNFEPIEAREFLSGLRTLLGPQGLLLIGVDLKKDAQLLNVAYNDAAGLTAAFNLNLLARMRRELCVEVEIEAFAHYAFYNETVGRIEMHLISRKAQRLRMDDMVFAFAQNESLHTENSYKYTVSEFHALSSAAGYVVERTWTDPGTLFSVHLLRVSN